MRAFSFTIAFLVVGAILVIMLGMSRTANERIELQYDPYAEGSVKVGLRELRYNLYGGGEVATTENPPSASVNFERGSMTLEETQFRIDNGDVVPLPDESEVVRVHYTDGQLRIAADGKPIYRGDFQPSDKQIR
jgi:hypothetical protein